MSLTSFPEVRHGLTSARSRSEVETVNYISFGSGEKKFVIIPGLSIHGVTGLAEQIAEAYQEFAEDYTVYVLDRPRELKPGMTIRELAEAAASTMQQLDIEDAYLFGASQGGMIAQYIAIDHPELVRKMILGSTLCRANKTFAQEAKEWMRLAESRNEAQLVKKFVEDVYSEKTLAAYRDVLISANASISEAEYDRFLILARSCQTFDCRKELHRIQCPVLVLGSEGDKVVTAKGSKEISEALNCEIYLYDSSYGHAVYDEAADYKQRCRAFFEKEA